MDAAEDALREKVQSKSDAEFIKFQDEMAPLIKRNIIAKRRTPFNIASNEGEKGDPDITL